MEKCRRIITAIASLAIIIALCQSVQGAGNIRFYIDKNNNLSYDAGEGYNGGWVDYKQKNSNSLVSAHLDANGLVGYPNAAAEDKFFCRKLIYSEPAVKGNHATCGGLFDLYLDSDMVSGNGSIFRMVLAANDANWINNGNTYLIRLAHPTLSWNLLVCLNWDAGSSYIGKLKTGFKKASNYLYDVTDGQMKLGNIDVRKNVGAATQLWADADIQITNDQQWPCSNPFGITAAGSHVYMPRLFDGNSRTTGDPDKSNYYRTFVHELGHYLLGFGDEYCDGNYSSAAWSTYRKNHKNDVPGNYGLMDYQYDASEMSSFNDYLVNYAIGTAASQATDEIWTYKLSAGGGVHRPCWQHLLDTFDNRNGLLNKWNNGYGGVRVVFLEPPYGVYQGRNNKGEIHTSSDRSEPGSITTCFFSFIEWDEATFFGAAASAPAPQGAELEAQDVELTVDGPTAAIDLSRTPLGTTLVGPKIMLEGNLSVAAGNHYLRIKLMSDVTLIGPPTVNVMPAFGTPIPVAMVPAGINTFSGTLNIGSNTEGGVDVTAMSTGGTTQTSTTFRVEHLPYDQEAVIHSPQGGLEARLPQGPLVGVTHSVTLGSGGAPIPTTDPLLICLTEPISFHLEDGAAAPPIYTTNWKFDRDTLAGRDAFTTTMRRFDPLTRTWVTVAYEFRPGYRMVSGQYMSDGIYAVFMRISSDVIPPGPVSNLYAATGESSKSVQLTWIAPGDNGPVGTSVRYNILFNTVPITTDNLADCKTLQVVDEPKTAGQPEDYGYEMPDPDTLYFFVIQAQDEAENLGAISNLASARSYVQDSDSDGLPDQWEETYGFNPTAPGEQNLDPDGDGLTNLEEYQHKTNPIAADTDDDGLSDGLEVMASTNPLDGLDPISTTVPGSKTRLEGTKLGIGNMACTASFADGSYAEELDKRSGIRLDGVTASAGNIIEVIGTLSTTASGERCLINCFYRTKDPLDIGPVAMNNRTIGGGTFGTPPQGQAGVKNGSGTNNIGLLIRTWGKVVDMDPTLPAESKTWFKIDDGSGVNVKCVVPSGVTIDPDWEYVVVTGVSSCEKPASDLYRLVRVRQQSDIVQAQ